MGQGVSLGSPTLLGEKDGTLEQTRHEEKEGCRHSTEGWGRGGGVLVCVLLC